METSNVKPSIFTRAWSSTKSGANSVKDFGQKQLEKVGKLATDTFELAKNNKKEAAVITGATALVIYGANKIYNKVKSTKAEMNQNHKQIAVLKTIAKKQAETIKTLKAENAQ